MSKHSSAPISDFARSSLARARRSRRRRSKSTRCSQSTAIVPYVGRAIEFSCTERSEVKGQIEEVRNPAPKTLTSAILPLTSDLLLPSAEYARGLKHGLLGWHGCVFQRRRERNWNVHRAHAFNRSVQIVECARGDHRRKFRGDSVAFIAFVENNSPRRFLCRFNQSFLVKRPHGARIHHFS